MATGLLPRLRARLNDILNGDTGLPSPIGAFAERIMLGDRIDQVARLGEVETRKTDPPDFVVGADLIAVPDSMGVLPGAAPHNVGQVLRDYATGFGGTLPPPANLEGAVVVEIDALGTRNARRLRESQIDPDFSIGSLSIDQGALQEIGATLMNPTFTATYVAVSPLTSASVIDNQGGLALDVLATPVAFTYFGAYTPIPVDTVVSWTLSATEDSFSDMLIVQTRWVNRVYFGEAAPAVYDEAFIVALGSSPLEYVRGRTFTLTASAAEHLHYAEPTRFDSGANPPTFIIGGFESIWVLVAQVLVTNASGFTESYDLWQSTNPGLGLTTTEVS